MVTPEEKKAAEREFAIAVKTKIDAALKDGGTVDMEALGKDYLADAEGKKHGMAEHRV